MDRHVIRKLVLIVVLAASCGAAQAQSPASGTPTPQALAAARELIVTTEFADKFKALMPAILKNMKGSVVQGRPGVEKDYDSLVPVLLAGMEARVSELEDAVVIIYATNFTVDEMLAVTAFYRSPAGKAYLSKSVAVSEQAMAAGQQFGKMVGAEMQKKMVDELRRKGHTI